MDSQLASRRHEGGGVAWLAAVTETRKKLSAALAFEHGSEFDSQRVVVVPQTFRESSQQSRTIEGFPGSVEKIRMQLREGGARLLVEVTTLRRSQCYCCPRVLRL